MKTEIEFKNDVSKLATEFKKRVPDIFNVGIRQTDIFEYEIMVVDPFGAAVQIFGVWYSKKFDEAYYCHGQIIRGKEKVI